MEEEEDTEEGEEDSEDEEEEEMCLPGMDGKEEVRTERWWGWRAVQTTCVEFWDGFPLNLCKLIWESS